MAIARADRKRLGGAAELRYIFGKREVMMLYLLTAALAQPAVQPVPALSRLTDCRPGLILMSGSRQVTERRDSGTRRPKPCMTLASARRG